MDSSMTDSGICRDLSVAKISIIGVVRAMKNREHMPPKVLEMRRMASSTPPPRKEKVMPKSCIE